jgi:hypothetical protein
VNQLNTGPGKECQEEYPAHPLASSLKSPRASPARAAIPFNSGPGWMRHVVVLDPKFQTLLFCQVSTTYPK